MGITIGCLIVSDSHIVDLIASHLDHAEFLRIFPFEISLIVLVSVVAALFLFMKTKTISRALRHREKLFIIALLVGLHTVGLIRGVIDTSDLIFGMIVVLWFVSVLASPQYKIVGAPLNLLNLALVLCAILAMINGGTNLIVLIPLIKAVVTSFLIVDIVRRKEWVIYLIRTFLIITTISALIAILQEVVFFFSGIILATYDPKHVRLVLESNSLGTFFRVPAFTGMHLFLANYLVISLLIILNIFLYYGKELNKKRRLTLTGMAFLMTAAFIFTFSKSNILGLLCGVFLSVILRWRSRWIHFAVYILLALVVAYSFGLGKVVHDSFLAQIELGKDVGLRAQLMRRGIEGFIYKHPLIGAGLGRGRLYSQDAFEWGAHNAFILAADDLGIVGFLVFSGLFLYGFIRVITTLAVVKKPFEKAFLRTLLAALVAYVINIQFQPDFLSYYNWILLAFIECTVIGFRKEYSDTSQSGYAFQSDFVLDSDRMR
jgi:hypothetical protein